jgi:hypothetical protein
MLKIKITGLELEVAQDATGALLRETRELNRVVSSFLLGLATGAMEQAAPAVEAPKVEAVPSVAEEAAPSPEVPAPVETAPIVEELPSAQYAYSDDDEADVPLTPLTPPTVAQAVTAAAMADPAMADPAPVLGHSAKKARKAEATPPEGEDKPKSNGWTEKRRVAQSEMMKQLNGRWPESGEEKPKRRGRVWTQEEKDAQAAKMREMRASGLVGGRKKKGFPATPLAEIEVFDENVPEPVVPAADVAAAVQQQAKPTEPEYDDEELAELQKPLPSPEEIFGPDAVRHARGEFNGIRDFAREVPGPAGRLVKA